MSSDVVLICLLLGTSMISSVIPQATRPECENCICCLSNQCMPDTDRFCDVCDDGYWGGRCFNRCPETCVKCDKSYNINPDCPICVDGYYGNICDNECRTQCLTCSGYDQCTACKERYYNSDTVTNCSLVASPCPSNCMFCYDSTRACALCDDGHYITASGNCLTCIYGCMRCSSGTDCTECRPNFTGSLCESCVAGKYGVDCDQDCPINCTSCTNQLICQQCQNGSYSGLSPSGGDLANDCRHSCPDSCYTCNSYTNCTSCKSSNYKGNACEDCVDGRHGATCTQDCPADCLNRVCVRDSGICVACKPGYDGDICDRCEDGKYGHNCHLHCSDGCKNKRCGRYDGGVCTDGCINDNIQGTKCDACIDEYYNTTCLSPCPVNCLNGICRKEDGTCTNGCISGKFGKNCTDSCSANCASDVCIQGNGTCSHGCLYGYSGDRCCVDNNNCEICSSNDICSYCVTGWHGDACDLLCSENCTDAGCNKENGNCLGCKSQRYGSKCENECPLNCMHDETTSRCDAGSGHCVGDCAIGYHGDMCDQICSINCNNATCSKEAAACQYGCKERYAGVSCTEVETGTPGSPAALIGGVVAGVVALAVIVILVVLFLRRRRSGLAQSHSPEPGNDDRMDEVRNTYDDLNLSDSPGNYGDYDTLDQDPASRTNGDKENSTTLTHEYVNTAI